MPRDGSGNFTLPYPDFTVGSTIVSAEVDSNNSHIADALTQSIARDGQSVPTASLPMGGFRHTGLGAGSAATDSVHLRQVQYQAWAWGGTAGGTADALALTPSPAIAAYAAGQAFRFIAAANNTGAATVNVSALGTKTIQNNGSALAANDIVSGKMYEIVYDGTQFQLQHVIAVTLAGLGAQAQDAALDDISGLAVTDGNIIVGNGANWVAESGATARASLGLAIGTDVQAFDADTLFADTADTLTAGFDATEYNAGTKSSGTFTPDPANGNFQKAVNGGAHTVAPPGKTCTIVIQYTNNASAGAITHSGFTLVDGDALTTTDGHDFLFYITELNGFSNLNVKALQ